MSLTLVTKYKKDGKLYTQFSVKFLNDSEISKINETILNKYPGNETFEILRETSVTSFSIVFDADDSFESNSFINDIQSILDINI